MVVAGDTPYDARMNAGILRRHLDQVEEHVTRGRRQIGDQRLRIARLEAKGRDASSAKDFLVQLGVPGDRLKTISYGKERPQCTESNESCWQRNRRAHFAPGQ